MANRFREKPVEEVVPPVPPKKEAPAAPAEPVEPAVKKKEPVKLGKAERRLSHLLGGDALADNFVLKQIPLVVLILVCFLFVVSNRYNVEKIIKERNDTIEQISRLRERRIEMQKQYQRSVKISHIAEVLQESGVGITAGPPYEIER